MSKPRHLQKSVRLTQTVAGIRPVLKEYDFRIHGKKRFDSILKGREQMMKTPYLKELLNIIEHSRYLETALKKIKQLK